jgi:hypothetical protein
MANIDEMHKNCVEFCIRCSQTFIFLFFRRMHTREECICFRKQTCRSLHRTSSPGPAARWTLSRRTVDADSSLQHTYHLRQPTFGPLTFGRAAEPKSFGSGKNLEARQRSFLGLEDCSLSRRQHEKYQMDPKLKRCRACGVCSEKMDKCPICKESYQLKWSDAAGATTCTLYLSLFLSR